MKDYLEKHPWKIIENTLIAENNLVSESVASLGNGRLGGRANFEEKFNGPTLQGAYIAGIYYPDKTKVGWWKNGYPEYFAKVLNSVNWIGIDIWVDGHDFELHPSQIQSHYAELDMQHGILRRETVAGMPDGKQIKIQSERFYSMQDKDRCYLKYSVSPVNFTGEVSLRPYLDFDVRNQDSNYDDSFWNHLDHFVSEDWGYVCSSTRKTDFTVLAGMKCEFQIEGEENDAEIKRIDDTAMVSMEQKAMLSPGQQITVIKHVCIASTYYYESRELREECYRQLMQSVSLGYEKAKEQHVAIWLEKWKDSDVVIEGDVSAQQGIRFNIFHMHQTYTGEDARLNIGPKGFTGEKYGGSTYWDTEAYCIPFYLSNADQEVARNLLKYRFNHLEKAIENAAKLGFKDEAALFPMVTMNGEECHNEWEITFEEIHRNGAIAYAIYDYIRYTGDEGYMSEYGLEVLIAIARFWRQRVNWSADKQKFVMLGVTGPNEYENNVNNNWYTNYIASWCLRYANDSIQWVAENDPAAYGRIIGTTNLDVSSEPQRWMEIVENMFYPVDAERQIFLQQEGFLDKELLGVHAIPDGEYPIHQNWSWDRILRSCYIKQADVLQGLYFFEDDFDVETIQRNFDFYEPMTVHESSLSPCIHAILACKIGNFDKAYEMYLRTARLDLDDYNNDTKDGLHITSMAGSWMSVVKGFGGMRVKEGMLHFDPHLPKEWKAFSFKIKFRESVIKVTVNENGTTIQNLSDQKINIVLKGTPLAINPHTVESLQLIA